MRLEIVHINHYRLRNGRFGSRAIQHLGEDAFITPPFPAILKDLRWAVFLRRTTPPQPVAIEEYNAAKHTPIIDARLAVALGKEALQTSHLRVAQPKKCCS